MEQEVNEINAGIEQKKDILLTEKDKHLFDLPSKIEHESIKLTCEFFDFNKFQNVGKLLVRDNQPLPPGEYSFAIYGDQDNVKSYDRKWCLRKQ